MRELFIAFYDPERINGIAPRDGGGGSEARAPRRAARAAPGGIVSETGRTRLCKQRRATGESANFAVGNLIISFRAPGEEGVGGANLRTS